MDRIGVIFGGKSTEHEVSLLSGQAVLNHIDRTKHEVVSIGITQDGRWLRYDGPAEKLPDGSWEQDAREIQVDDLPGMIDFALPILHGANGEDGTIQGLFEMLGLPYAGCGVLGSSLCMDKAAAKMVFQAAGIPTSDFVLIDREKFLADEEGEAARCEEALTWPMFVKPANAGSSVGISKVKDHQGLTEGLREAFKYDRRVIVEVGIDARELETGVIGNGEPMAAGVGEISAAHDFYDYDAKYSDDAGTVITIPAEIPDEMREKIREIAVRAYRVLDCAGFSRVDFLADRKTGEVYLNELNTIPGFTKYSMFPMLWGEEGVSFSELIERIIAYGYERYRDKNNRQTVRR